MKNKQLNIDGVNNLQIENANINKEGYIKEYIDIYEKVGNSKAIYKGEQVPFFMIPKVFTEEDVKNAEKAVADITNIVNKSIDLYIDKPKYRKIFNFEPKLEELILLDHGYEARVPMGRYDIFYYPNGDYKFCELNTDGTSAQSEDHALVDILKDSISANDLKNGEYEIEPFELFYSWAKELKNIYSEFKVNRKLDVDLEKNLSDVTVAIVDFIGEKPSIEFLEFKEAIEGFGFSCIIVDPRKISCRDGHMYGDVEGKSIKIDLVYRRLVTRDMMEKYDEMPGFIESIKANKTCMVGSIKTQIVHTKKFFEALYNEDFRSEFSAEELEYIDAHIPYTKKLDDVKLIDKYVTEKEKYLIKPIDLYASKGVYAGSDFGDDEWKEILAKNIGDEYLIQEYCPISKSKNIIFDDELIKKGDTSNLKFEEVEIRNITGMYVYNEKLSGFYSRAGLNAIISGLHNGYTLGSFKSSKIEK